MSLGTQIRARREALGLSQAALAKEIGVTQSRVSNWERGYRNVIGSTLLTRLADALKTSTDYLLERTN